MEIVSLVWGLISLWWLIALTVWIRASAKNTCTTTKLLEEILKELRHEPSRQRWQEAHDDDHNDKMGRIFRD